MLLLVIMKHSFIDINLHYICIHILYSTAIHLSAITINQPIFEDFFSNNNCPIGQLLEVVNVKNRF